LTVEDGAGPVAPPHAASKEDRRPHELGDKQDPARLSTRAAHRHRSRSWSSRSTAAPA